MFAYYSGASGNGGIPFSRLLYESAIMKFKVVLLVCFIWAFEFGVLDLLLSCRFRALHEKGCLRVNEVILIPLSREMMAKIKNWRMLTIINDCENVRVLALLTHARMNKSDLLNSVALGWCLYDFTTTINIVVPE